VALTEGEREVVEVMEGERDPVPLRRVELVADTVRVPAMRREGVTLRVTVLHLLPEDTPELVLEREPEVEAVEEGETEWVPQPPPATLAPPPGVGVGQAEEDKEAREERERDKVTVGVEVMEEDPLVEALDETDPEVEAEAEDDLDSVGMEVEERVALWLTDRVRREEAVMDVVEVEEGVTPVAV
jgi:hypothetical protein